MKRSESRVKKKMKKWSEVKKIESEESSKVMKSNPQESKF